MVQFLTHCTDLSITGESVLLNVLGGKNADQLIATKRKRFPICLSCWKSNALVARTRLLGYVNLPFIKRKEQRRTPLLFGAQNMVLTHLSILSYSKEENTAPWWYDQG